jgi:hypothetical protein
MGGVAATGTNRIGTTDLGEMSNEAMGSMEKDAGKMEEMAGRAEKAAGQQMMNNSSGSNGDGGPGAAQSNGGGGIQQLEQELSQALQQLSQELQQLAGGQQGGQQDGGMQGMGGGQQGGGMQGMGGGHQGGGMQGMGGGMQGMGGGQSVNPSDVPDLANLMVDSGGNAPSSRKSHVAGDENRLRSEVQSGMQSGSISAQTGYKALEDMGSGNIQGVEKDLSGVSES